MKVKKILVSCLLAVMLALSSLTLFACGKKQSSADIYKNYNDTFILFREDYVVFGQQTLFDVNSKYYVNYLYSKNKDGQKTQYTIQNSLSAYGLNFIEKYYPYLQNYEGKAKLKAVASCIDSLNEEFAEMKGEIERLTALPDIANRVVYNGHFARYRVEFNDFAGVVFDTANALADFMIEGGFTNSVGTDELNQKELEIYLDVQKLRIISDYEKFFFESCRGLNLSEAEYVNARNQYSAFTTAFKSGKNKALTSEQAKDLQAIFNVVTASRGDYEQAIDSFSFYDYVNAWGYSIEAYLKEEDNALAFYNKICDYLWKDHGVYKLLANYLTKNVVE